MKIYAVVKDSINEKYPERSVLNILSGICQSEEEIRGYFRNKLDSAYIKDTYRFVSGLVDEETKEAEGIIFSLKSLKEPVEIVYHVRCRNMDDPSVKAKKINGQRESALYHNLVAFTRTLGQASKDTADEV